LRVSEPDPPPGAPAFERSGSEILRVRLRTLGDGDKASMQAFVASARVARSAPMVIVDIRGNPGGNDTFVTDWFKGLTTGALHYSVTEELHSEVTLQGQANLRICMLASRRLSPADRPGVQRDLGTAMSRIEDAARRGEPFR
jgi:hypothetical protein